MSNRTRSNAILIYLSDEELARLNGKMNTLGIRNRSGFLRKLILDGYCVRLDYPELQKMLSLLGRCSNNLNQYARMANATGIVYAKDIQELHAEFDEIHQLMRNLLDKITSI